MKVTTKIIRGTVASWLRYEKRCPLVTFERGLSLAGIPDILALTESRHLIEVEIKISLNDFNRDWLKSKWKGYSFSIKPKQFYFAAPSSLALKIREKLPKGAGLISVQEDEKSLNGYTQLPAVDVLVGAKINPEAKRINIKSAMKMVWNQSGTLCSLAVQAARMEISKT